MSDQAAMLHARLLQLLLLLLLLQPLFNAASPHARHVMTCIISSEYLHWLSDFSRTTFF